MSTMGRRESGDSLRMHSGHGRIQPLSFHAPPTPRRMVDGTPRPRRSVRVGPQATKRGPDELMLRSYSVHTYAHAMSTTAQ